MKQHTNSEQTAKLIELGFEKPKSIVSVQISWTQQEYRRDTAYSIGELIEHLPPSLNFADGEWPLSIESDPFLSTFAWWVYYSLSCQTKAPELIDALYEMAVKLKEEGVI